jgi:hypothetical protein
MTQEGNIRRLAPGDNPADAVMLNTVRAAS